MPVAAPADGDAGGDRIPGADEFAAPKGLKTQVLAGWDDNACNGGSGREQASRPLGTALAMIVQNATTRTPRKRG